MNAAAWPDDAAAAQRAFRAGPPVRSLADVRRLEERPLDQAVTASSTYEIFRNAAAAFGHKRALTFLHTAEPGAASSSLSYVELLQGIHRTANALHALGVGARDSVAIMLPGCLEYHLALWGGEAAGIVQPLNPMLNEDKLAALLNATGAVAMIAYGSDRESGIWSKALRLAKVVPTLRVVLRVRPVDESNLTGETPSPEADSSRHTVRMLDFEAALASQPHDHLLSGRVPRPTDIASYFHTGGTTGAPKLAIHTHANQVFTAWAGMQLQGAGPSDVVINGYPLFHVAGVLPSSLAALSAGAEIVIPTTALMRNRDIIRNYWRLVEHHRATSLQGVPTVLAALAEVPLDGADISSLRYCRTGAALLPPELAARFERQFGLHVHESLGMTEMAGISSITPPGVIGPVGCVGFPLPYARMRIVALDSLDGNGRDLPVGEVGMVLFRSPNVFPGYLDAADTADAFTEDGWLITGDIGLVDEAGRLHLKGRAKDLIIRSGHNIDPKAIEDALGGHPAVRLCAAVGAPDAYAGELPVAYAVLAEGVEVSETELLAYAASHVEEAPARPKRITILPTLPTTNVGKIYKPELRRLAAEAAVMAEAQRLWLAAGETGVPPLKIWAESASVVSVTSQGAINPASYESLRQGLQRLPLDIRFRDA
ncbi:long-chain-fatty-acid-CoA ligase [Bordetella ansorpii]|uniref:Long-chain-fatty-acid-CoA ligase n=1 Tax=Bordetella ansorpii TaxID=288768 RepID=A0A157S9R2_9BORD|nr:acyl-CoA synthetase [Bordetella ansorpii]SAI66646.1 long-chain-fatty-acid-CoA ligase [Bordetella ansorpii]